MSKLMQDVLVRNQHVWGGWILPSGGSSYNDIIWNADANPPTESEWNTKVVEDTPIIAMDALREHRDSLLKESDWTQTPDVPESIKNEWTAYRQALRDLPTNSPNATIENDRLVNVTWPTKPEGA